MNLRFRHNRCPVDPRYPDAWRGETGVYAQIGNTGIRLRWFYARRENDWMRVDGYKRINISPRWAKWFQFSSYYAGQSRNMYHLTVGHFGVSVIPFAGVAQLMM